MAITEVFPNPTVKQVVFQARFPDLFTMESLVGQYQMQIMERFPKSSLSFTRQFLLAGFDAPEGRSVQLPEQPAGQPIAKKWIFSSDTGVEIRVSTGDISLTSLTHKTYRNAGAASRFRDALEYAMGRFLSVVRVPSFSRVGLRYIDECPVRNDDPTEFRKWYNTSLDVDRFPLSDAQELSCVARIARGRHALLFRETLKKEQGVLKLTLDFDGYALAVDTAKYLSTTDELHDLISDEYVKSIREPVYAFMKNGRPT